VLSPPVKNCQANIVSPTAKLIASTPGQDALAAAHSQLLSDSDLQFRFGAFVPDKPPDWLAPLLRFITASAPAMKIVFWCLVAALAAYLLFLVGRELWLRRGAWARAEPAAKPVWPEWRPGKVDAELLLSDADKLALQGKYDKAVHLILLRSIQDIGRHRPVAVKPALTSREISLAGSLPESARHAFATIARVVERSLFGGFDVTVAEFRACRDEYERFAFPETWSGSGAR
jgi:hypothetical protein